MKTTQDETILISTGFEQGFSLRHAGSIRKFGACTWHDDDSTAITYDGSRFWLVFEGSRDEGFPELRREELTGDAEVTLGYHPEERGEWMSLAELAERRIAAIA